ncbi:arginine--tRNA ligase [Sedimentibacter sp. zth1]|uniref:arginine--tRNA ligase n=1 Tax=Sedimentibacter sp. zth1 TaxID=2816908 RepID=UPI001A92A388|nr:arginine--tRNA ligase [Sedimentibacter sp. zth1]QSX06299.1 arginine--tRNA ligase [Sedimentibacter sp. zth1]
MKTLLQILTEKVSDAFKKCGYNYELGRVTVSDRQDLCEFQCNGALSGAKQYKKAPRIIANEIKEKLVTDSDFEKVEVIGAGFININISSKLLIDYLVELNADKSLGIPQTENQETVVVDYGGPNCAKPLHIGHLRAAIIGESLKRIALKTGRNAIGDVHLGDWGLQIGLVIAEVLERFPEYNYNDNNFDEEHEKIIKLNAEMLNEIYPFASKKSKENTEFKSLAQQITAKMQKGHKGYLSLWKQILDISKDDFKIIYDSLNVHFEYWYGESDAEKYVDRLTQILEDKNLLYESNGAMVVDVQQEDDKTEIPPVIIKKSDNSSIYATSDLATILQRQLDFQPTSIWYVVDSRQSLHFNQVFRCAKKASIVDENATLEHLGFGTMNGKDGKPFKTRDGGVMKLSDLYDIVYEKALEKLSESNFVSKENIDDTAKKITVAALKFGDLINHRLKDYVFDVDKFIATKGKTGVFLLYTVARINSLLKKLENSYDGSLDIKNIYSKLEKELLLKIALTPEVFVKAFNEKAPNYICDNAYDLASVYSSFYNDNHITTETDMDKKKTWISLSMLVKKVLVNQLDALGIETVEEM